MKHVESLVGQAFTRPAIGDLLNHLGVPERGDSTLTDTFKQRLLSNNPSIVIQAIPLIQNSGLPLHTAAHVLTEFMDKPHFHDGKYERILYRVLSPKNPPDTYLDYYRFFDASTPFEESTHYLTIISEGLARLHDKAYQAKSIDELRPHHLRSLERCVTASTELVADSLKRKDDSVNMGLLQHCDFGRLWNGYSELFTDKQSFYDRTQRGFRAIDQYGIENNQGEIQTIPERVE